MARTRNVFNDIASLSLTVCFLCIFACSPRKENSNPIAPPPLHLVPQVTIMQDTTVSIHDTVLLFVTVGGNEASKLKFLWRPGGAIVDTTDSPYLPYAFPDSGMYKVIVHGFDHLDSASNYDTCTITVRLYPPLVIAHDSALSVDLNDSIMLDAYVHDDNGKVILVLWKAEGASRYDTTTAATHTFAFSDSGIRHVYVWAIDDDSVSSTPDTFSVTVTAEHPQVLMEADSAVQDINDTLTITAQATDNGTIVKYIWALRKGIYADTTSAGNIDAVYGDTGTRRVFVRAIDDDGLLSAPDSMVVRITAEKPVVHASEAIATNTGDSIQIKATAEGNSPTFRYLWAKDGSNFLDTTIIGAFTTVFSARGRYIVLVKVIDEDAIVSDADSIHVLVRGTPPVITVMHDTAIGINDSVTLHGTVMQNATAIRFAWALDGNDFTDTTSLFAKRLQFPDSGHKLVAVKAIDEDSQESNVDTIGINVIANPPSISAMNDTSVNIHDSILLTATATDNGSIVKYLWYVNNSDPVSTTTGSFKIASADSGTMHIAVVAVDNDSLASLPDTIVVNVLAHHPIVHGMDDATITIYDSITVTATGTDDGTILTYLWSVNAADAVSTTTGSFKFSTADSGTTRIVVVAVDDDSLASLPDTILLHVLADPPSVSIMYDTAITINDSITITAVGTDHGTVLRYLWYTNNAGDSVETSTGNLRIAFPDSGLVTIVVKCVDDDSMLSPPDTCRITVRADAPLVTPLPDTMVSQSAVVAIAAHATDRNSDGTIQMFYWDIGADGADIDSTVSGNRIFTNPAGGWFTVAWWVRDDDNQISADTFRILFNRAPGTPSISPVSGATALLHTYTRGSNQGSVRMRFPAVDPDGTSEPLTYTLYYGLSSGTVTQVYTGSNSSFIISDLLPGTTYYWQISVHDLFGDSTVQTGNFIAAQPCAGMVLLETEGTNFTFGSTQGEIDEQPVSTTGFSSNRWIDTTEVTQGAYAARMTAYTGYTAPTWTAYGSGTNLPVYNITWYDAVLFCNARSKNEGLDTVYTYSAIVGTPGNGSTLTDMVVNYTAGGYRLPTEAEWEFACRASTQSDYPWGSDDASLFAWYFDNAAGATHPVAQKSANGFGLYDMCGNVAEYCGDWYGSYSSIAKTDPAGPDEGSSRVIRGGGLLTQLSHLKSASRLFTDPSTAGIYGFRVVRNVGD